MRHNGFGEAYCHTSTELLAELERKDEGPATVYVTNLHPGDGEFRASGAAHKRHEQHDGICTR